MIDMASFLAMPTIPVNSPVKGVRIMADEIIPKKRGWEIAVARVTLSEENADNGRTVIMLNETGDSIGPYAAIPVESGWDRLEILTRARNAIAKIIDANPPEETRPGEKFKVGDRVRFIGGPAAEFLPARGGSDYDDIEDVMSVPPEIYYPDAGIAEGLTEKIAESAKIGSIKVQPLPTAVFIAVPSRDGRLPTRAAYSIYTDGAATTEKKIACSLSSSILTYTFNSLWCAALNMREQGITHFAMLHDDIQPADGWIDTLLEEMNRVDADIISVVVPLKENSGLTSTAIDTDPWRPRRLTMREVAKMPETFSRLDLSPGMPEAIPLLINTGCWLCKFTDEWVARACFHVRDKIIRTNGHFEPRVASEDWEFSRFARKEGLKVYATTKVHLTHSGTAQFQNWGLWGQETDEVNIPEAPSSPDDTDEPQTRDIVSSPTMSL